MQIPKLNRKAQKREMRSIFFISISIPPLEGSLHNYYFFATDPEMA